MENNVLMIINDSFDEEKEILKTIKFRLDNDIEGEWLLTKIRVNGNDFSDYSVRNKFFKYTAFRLLDELQKKTSDAIPEDYKDTKSFMDGLKNLSEEDLMKLSKTPSVQTFAQKLITGFTLQEVLDLGKDDRNDEMEKFVYEKLIIYIDARDSTPI